MVLKEKHTTLQSVLFIQIKWLLEINSLKWYSDESGQNLNLVKPTQYDYRM